MKVLGTPNGFRPLLLALLGTLFAQSSLFAELRTWTRADGKTVQAELVTVDDGKATLRLENGTEFGIEVLQLSLSDQNFLAEEAGKPKTTGTSGARIGASFPLADPASLSERPTAECRIAIVKIPTNKIDLSHTAFEQIEKEDLTDIVKLGSVMQGASVLAIRKNGDAVLWKDSGETVTPHQSDALIAFDPASQLEMVWVTSDGILRSEGQNRDLDREMRRIGEVVKVQCIDNGIFAVTADGKRHLFDPRRSGDLTGAGIDLQNVAEIAPRVANTYVVLDREGVTYHFTNGKLDKKSGPREFVALPHSHLRHQANDNFVGFAMAHAFAQTLNWDAGAPLPRIHLSPGISAHRVTADGKWDVWVQSDKWQMDDKWTQTFEDAVDLYMANGQYLYALFPAEKLPRSGYWELNELFSALQ